MKKENKKYYKIIIFNKYILKYKIIKYINDY
uniref:Uncharacterized protein n=1 Tax=viral metagenome TaxID=1070528 RepID=A0A6C0EHW5_9ZZZZ